MLSAWDANYHVPFSRSSGSQKGIKEQSHSHLMILKMKGELFLRTFNQSTLIIFGI